MSGERARNKFVDSHIRKSVAFQIQSLRNKRGWSQPKLAQNLKTNQNAVYRLENPNYGKQTIATLKKVAAVFDVALMVRFVPFSQLVDWVSETPRVDPGLNPEALAVPSFEDELQLGNFDKHSPEVEAPRRSGTSIEHTNPEKQQHIESWGAGKAQEVIFKSQRAYPISNAPVPGQTAGGPSLCSSLQ